MNVSDVEMTVQAELAEPVPVPEPHLALSNKPHLPPPITKKTTIAKVINF